jgi:hypothetical protein
VSGNTQTSSEKRAELARQSQDCPRAAGFCGYASHTARGIGYAEELSPTLKGNDWQAQVPDVLTSETLVMASGQANAEIAEVGVTPTLTCYHEQPIVCMADDAQNAAVDENLSGTLKVGGAAPIVALSAQ